MFRVVLLMCLLFGLETQAFMNIESIRQNAKEGNSGALGLKLNGSSGNSDRVLSEFSTLNLWRNELNEYLVAAKYRYGESQHVKDAHDANLHLRYTHYFDEAPALESFIQTEFDEFRKLSRRDLVGLGARTLLERQDQNAFYLGTGLFYERQYFTENIPDEQTLRANLYLSYVRALTESISANVIAYYQPSVQSLADTRAQLDTSLEIALGQKLGLSIEYDLVYDSRPAPDVKKLDSKYLVGLAYKF